MRGLSTSYFPKTHKISFNQPLTRFSVINFPRKSQPWRDTVRKKLGAALLLVTLSCGMANADVWVSGHRMNNKPNVTFIEQIHQAWNHLFNWF